MVPRILEIGGESGPWFAGQSNIDRPERHFGRNPPGLCCVNMISWNEQY
jgi:hypothetical protein